MGGVLHSVPLEDGCGVVLGGAAVCDALIATHSGGGQHEEFVALSEYGQVRCCFCYHLYCVFMYSFMTAATFCFLDGKDSQWQMSACLVYLASLSLPH